MKTPTTLIIMDGFGMEGSTPGNAVINAPTPNLDRIFSQCPGSRLSASGLDVGLPDGQMGNSEVGHTNIGAGRVVFQDLPHISRDIDSGVFFQNGAESILLRPWDVAWAYQSTTQHRTNGIPTGKTYAAACIANYLLNRRRSVVMTSFVKLLESMMNFKEDDSVLISRLNRAKLLIIDDLGAERSTDFALEKVYDIVDSRYRAKLPVILTTNLSMDELMQATDIRYTRIYDRIFEMCYPLEFVGRSWRKAEANRRFKDFETFMEEGDDG